MEGDLLATGGVEGHAQQLADAGEHADGAGGVLLAHEDGDGVERVEEEVRVELGAQGFELRMGQARFEL